MITASAQRGLALIIVIEVLILENLFVVGLAKRRPKCT